MRLKNLNINIVSVSLHCFELFLCTSAMKHDKECTAHLDSDDVALSQQQQSFNYHQFSGSAGAKSQISLSNNKHIYTQNTVRIISMQDKLYTHKFILIGLVTMFLPKPPSVPGWWLYRCGHGRHCRGSQHLGCFSNSMCQSRPTQGRTSCLKEKHTRVLLGAAFWEMPQSC